MESRLYPRKFMPGCRADCYLPRRFFSPLPIASNRPIRNLSLAGISLLGLKELPRGTVLRLTIMGPGTLPSFEVQGTVRWADRVRNERGGKLTITGIEFSGVDEKIQEYIQLMLDWKNSDAAEEQRLAAMGSGRRSAF